MNLKSIIMRISGYLVKAKILILTICTNNFRNYLFNKGFFSLLFQTASVAILIVFTICFSSTNTLPQSFSGTCIVLYVNNDSIIVGVDSRVVVHHVTGWEETINWCKIGSSNGIFFTFAGTSDTSQFNILRLAQTACTKDSSIDSVSKIFCSLFAPALNSYLKTPIGKLSKVEPVNIVFFGLQDKKPYAVSLNFSFVDTLHRKSFLNAELNPINLQPKFPGYGLFGTYEAIADFLKYHENYIESVSGVEFVESLLELQAATTPDIVGGEISLLCVTRNGVDWINKTKECQISQYVK